MLSEVGHQTTMAPTPGVPATLGPVSRLTTEQEVYIRNGNGGEELYDRVQDPGETQNRISAGSVPQSVELYQGTLRPASRLVEKVSGLHPAKKLSPRFEKKRDDAQEIVA